MLKTRILTILIGTPVVLFFIYLGGYWYGLFVAIVSLLGIREYFHLMRRAGWNAVELSGYLFVPLALFTVYSESPALVISIWVLFFISINLFSVFWYTKVKIWDSAVTFWGIIYTGGLASFIIAIRLLPQGLELTLLFFLLIWTTDVTAYIVGSFWGRRPIAPILSPSKTVEGTFGGLAGSSLAGMLLPVLLLPGLISLQEGFLLGLVIGIIGAVGDLNQSAFKRNVGAKDSGDILPGHGGILDRFDSLFFASPFFYMIIIYLI